MNKYYNYSIYHSIKDHTNYLIKTLYIKNIPFAFTRKFEGTEKEILDYLNKIKKDIGVKYEII